MASILHGSPALWAVLFLLATFSAQASARCPGFKCFCSKRTADRLCRGRQGECEVAACTTEKCARGGWKCQTKPKPANVPGILSAKAVQRMQQNITKNGGCRGNVCFAIDGSGSISPTGYQKEKAFVTSVVQIIEYFGPRLAGTQYSDKSYPITPLTLDPVQFLNALNTQNQVGGSTSISSGINFCFGQLKSRVNDFNKVVVLGDGFQNVDQNAIQSADNVRDINPPTSNGLSLVSAVAVGPSNLALLNGIADGDASLVFQVTSFNDILGLAHTIEDLTYAICVNP